METTPVVMTITTVGELMDVLAAYNRAMPIMKCSMRSKNYEEIAPLNNHIFDVLLAEVDETSLVRIYVDGCGHPESFKAIVL